MSNTTETRFTIITNSQIRRRGNMDTTSPPIDLRRCERCGDFMNKRRGPHGAVLCGSCGSPIPERYREVPAKGHPARQVDWDRLYSEAVDYELDKALDLERPDRFEME